MKTVSNLSALALISLSAAWFYLAIHYYCYLTDELFRYNPATYIAVENWLITSVFALTITVIAFFTFIMWQTSRSCAEG